MIAESKSVKNVIIKFIYTNSPLGSLTYLEGLFGFK